MEIEIGEWIAQARSGVATIPPAIIAVILLAGPTVCWLLYRFIVEPRYRRMRGRDMAAMWVCANCRSVNELRMARCYRCDARPVEAELEVIDSHPDGHPRLTPVGPGLDLGGPRPRRINEPRRRVPVSVAEEVASLIEETHGPGAIEPAGVKRKRPVKPRGPVPVGPGRPVTARPRRAVVAGGNAERKGPRIQDPDEPPAA
jgi:hypothetical protein